MGRPKQYDRIELLDRAADLFHRQGYEATTTAQLVAELGVNRKSMYAEFGSKQELFEAALERYETHHLSQAIRAVEADDASLDGIRRAFAGYVGASGGWARGRGCLLANTAVERASQDDASARHVDAYYGRLDAAFGRALQNAVVAREIDPGADVPALAKFLTMSLIGVAVSARAQQPPANIAMAVDVVMGVLENSGPAS
ncbi:MAG: TetR/AcrR family transcriptional regulator [Proteobacteria bacterium]|nr:TetR/AcrR family transcriptional regulator [Pseudomonadota bacterium]